ncbi:MAG: ORF6N domain-containing protein [Steroidobacteraceae bacterium]
MTDLPDVDAIEGTIHVVRARRVMLDADLARLYGVKTERLNEQVRRNQNRFPADFMFQLTAAEWHGGNLLQIATGLQRTIDAPNRPQFAGGSQRHRDPARPPLAFTEHGCLMAANVLRSGRAVEVSVLVVRAFVRMRSAVAANTALAATVDKLARQVEQHGGKLATHDEAILKLLAEIRRLTRFPETPRRGIGFTAEWSERE